MHRNCEYPELHVPARPCGVERCPPTRRRRRGPRSLRALQRRARQRFTPPSGACGESQAAPLGAPDGVTIVPTTHSLLSSATDVGQAERDGSERFTPFNRPSCSSSAIAAGQAVRDGSERTNCVTFNFPNANDSSSLSRGFSQRTRIWSVNVRKLLRRKAELEARLKNAAVDVLMLQETWLADTVEELAIEGYYLVGRLDREAGPKAGYGGVAIYAKATISCIALLEHSSGAERSWCILHTNIGAILLGNWYRAPDAGESSIDSLATELERLGSEVIGVILTGDINIHHRKWLRHSRDNSTIGERLWNVC